MKIYYIYEFVLFSSLKGVKMKTVLIVSEKKPSGFFSASILFCKEEDKKENVYHIVDVVNSRNEWETRYKAKSLAKYFCQKNNIKTLNKGFFRVE